MTNVSDYPITVDGVRLDTLAKGVEASSLTLGGLRSADTLLAGLDGVVASVGDSREPSSLGLSMFVRGTDDDGLVPAGRDGQAVYQENLQALKHLLAKSGTLLDVRRTIDKNTMMARTNLLSNPRFAGLSGAPGVAEIRRNLLTNPSWRTTSGTVEVRRNLFPNPSFETALTGWTIWQGTAGVAGLTRETTGGWNGPGFARATWTTAPTAGGGFFSPIMGSAAGTIYTASAYVRPSVAVNIAPQWQFYNSGAPTTSSGSANVACPANVWTRVPLTTLIPAGSNQIQWRWYVSGAGLAVGSTMDFDAALMEDAETTLPFMDGTTPTADGLTYSWAGVAHASESIATGPKVIGGVFVAYTTQGLVGWQSAPGVYRMMAKNVIPTASLVGYSGTDQPPGAPGLFYSGRFKARQVSGAGPISLSANLAGYAAGYQGAVAAVIQALPVGGPLLDVAAPSTAAAPATTATVRWVVNSSGAIPAGTVLEMTTALVEQVGAVGSQAGAYFDGASPTSDGLVYSWAAAADASASIAKGNVPTGVQALNGAKAWQGADGKSLRIMAASSAAGGAHFVLNGLVAAGDVVSAGADVSMDTGAPLGSLSFVMTSPGTTVVGAPYVAPPGRTLTNGVTMPAGLTTVTLRFYATGGDGALYTIRNAVVEKAATAGPALDGTTPGAGWDGAADASTSTLDSSDLQAWAKVQDAITPEDHPGDVGRLSAVLMVPGVYWRSLLALAWQGGPVNAGTAYEVTSLQGSSAPIDDAVLCLTGPANAGAQIIDDATGSFVRLNEALPAGSTWRVNVGTWESRVGVGLTVDSADTAGTDKSGVTDQGGIYPRLLRLNPRLSAGARRVKVRTAGGGFTAATTLTIKARRAHL